MKLSKRQKIAPQINLTSLIDILFILIIFFSVTTRFKNESGLDVDLPKSKFSKQLAQKKSLNIFMREDNLVSIKGKKYPLIELEKKIKDLIPDSNEFSNYILKIDKQVNHGSVIRLLDTLKENGINKVSFSVQK